MTTETTPYYLLQSTERSAVHLEMRDSYAPDDPDWLKWHIRYEYDVTAVFNLAAGEQVRWLPRRQATGLLVPPVDFWVFDERLVVWNHVAGDGSSLPRERCDDTSIAKTCVVAFDAVWERGIPHERYRPA